MWEVMGHHTIFRLEETGPSGSGSVNHCHALELESPRPPQSAEKDLSFLQQPSVRE